MELEFLQYIQTWHTPVLDRIFVFITSLGNVGWFFIVVGIALLVPKSTRKTGLQILLALLFSSIFCNLILKDLVARDRPSWLMPQIELLIKNPKDFSFPSGHTSASFAFALSILCYHKRWGTAALVLAVLIAFSRMYLFVHFPTDILGGIITGTLSAMLSYVVMQKGKKRRNNS